jgi:hypothetical protein
MVRKISTVSRVLGETVGTMTMGPVPTERRRTNRELPDRI